MQLFMKMGTAGAKIKKNANLCGSVFVNFCLETENGANLRLPFFPKPSDREKKKTTPKLQQLQWSHLAVNSSEKCN